MPTDVAEIGRAENRVGHGMAHDIRVRMPQRAATRRDGHTGQHQPPSIDQPMQIVTGSNSPGSTGAGVTARGREIFVGRDLHIRRFAAYHVDGMAGPLGERRFICRLDAGSSHGDRGGEHVAAETLRRLRQEDGFTRHRLDDDVTLDALDGVAHLEGRGSPRHGGRPRQSLAKSCRR